VNGQVGDQQHRAPASCEGKTEAIALEALSIYDLDNLNAEQHSSGNHRTLVVPPAESETTWRFPTSLHAVQFPCVNAEQVRQPACLDLFREPDSKAATQTLSVIRFLEIFGLEYEA
jgi:hypothetical protein